MDNITVLIIFATSTTWGALQDIPGIGSTGGTTGREGNTSSDADDDKAALSVTDNNGSNGVSRPAIVWSALAGEIEDISIDATATAASAAGKLDEEKNCLKVKQNNKHTSHASEETR